MSGWPRTAKRFGGAKLVLEGLQADIFCIQETKMSSSQLTADLANLIGFQSYWHFNTSPKRQGYSGVAVYTRHEAAPARAQAGFAAVLQDEGAMLPHSLVHTIDKAILHTGLTCRELDAEGVSTVTRAHCAW